MRRVRGGFVAHLQAKTVTGSRYAPQGTVPVTVLSARRVHFAACLGCHSNVGRCLGWRPVGELANYAEGVVVGVSQALRPAPRAVRHALPWRCAGRFDSACGYVTP